MSALAIGQTKTALGPNLTASFLGTGGTGPYTYEVLTPGAGGTINSSTGLYTAPATVSSNPANLFDQIQVTDSLGDTAQASILVGTPLLLFCDIIQNQMGLANDHIYLWDQKLFQPTDSSLYVAVSVLSCKPFGNSNTHDSSGNSVQTINMYAQLQLDIISRGPEARDRKEEVIMALKSDYSESQQEANSFYIGSLPAAAQFRNLSSIDGAAIPYRFAIDVAMQYSVTKTQTVPYFDTFSTEQVITNP